LVSKLLPYTQTMLANCYRMSSER